MAGSKSDYLENKVLDHILGAVVFTTPATVYMHLFTVAPSDTGGGTEVSTGAWTNYARATITNNAANWPAAVGGVKSNGAMIDFGTAVIVSPVTVIGWALKDNAGNFLYWGDFASGVAITNGDPVRFNIGDLTLTET